MYCPLVFEFSVGIGGFVIGLSQISFFFSSLNIKLKVQQSIHTISVSYCISPLISFVIAFSSLRKRYSNSLRL